MTWQGGASGSRPRPEGPGLAGRGALPHGPVGPRGPGTVGWPSLPRAAAGESGETRGHVPLTNPCALLCAAGGTRATLRARRPGGT